jgi:hypothetical protein
MLLRVRRDGRMIADAAGQDEGWAGAAAAFGFDGRRQ